MSEEMLLPKFLTKEIAATCITSVLDLVLNRGIAGITDDKTCHVVVLVPSMKDDRETDYPDYPNYPIVPHLLQEMSIGKEKWNHHFDDLVKCKALQLWHGRNDDRTDIMPHLLFPNDTRYWGGVKRHGIVVACSGFQAWIDKMVSGMIADMMVGMAYEAWMQSDDFKRDADFIA